MATEQELWELLHQEQARNAGTAQPEASKPPVQLTPEMLLSAAGAREVRYAQQLKGIAPMSKDAYLRELVADPALAAAISHGTVELSLPRPTAQIVVTPALQPVTTGVVTLQPGQDHSVQELEQLWSNTDPDDPAGLAAQFGQGDAVLANLWDHTVPEGAEAFRTEYAGEFMPAPHRSAFDPADIQFDGDNGDIQFNDEGPGISHAARERTRFRVDRQDPPPRPPIDRYATPVDGQVVSQRGADGRFMAVQRAIPPHPREARELWDGGQPPRRAAPPVDRSSIPNAWERVMGEDDF